MSRKLSKDDCSEIAQPVNTSNGNRSRGRPRGQGTNGSPRHSFQRTKRLKNGDGVSEGDTAGPESQIANTIALRASGLWRYSLRSASQRAGEPSQAKKQGDEEEEEEVGGLEDDLDWAAPKKHSKQRTPRERHRLATKEIVEIEDDESDEETVVDPDGHGLIPNGSPEPVQANGQSRPGQGTSTPYHFAPSRGNKRRAESTPITSYASSTPSNASRSGVKRQKSSNAIPHRQSQVSRVINWDAVLPSGDEFKENLKHASDAIKPVLRKFEELLADINDEQRKLCAVQSSLFQKKNDYTNDQKKAQDDLKDVENSTANENTTLRGLEEVYQQNPGDAELRTFINKRKQTILEHEEVHVIAKSQLEKSINGIKETDHEIALVTKRLGQLDAERADVLREKEGVDKAAKRATIMSKFMEPSWQDTLDRMMDNQTVDFASFTNGRSLDIISSATP